MPYSTIFICYSRLSSSRKLSSHIVFSILFHRFTGIKSVGCAVQLNKWGTSCRPTPGQPEEYVCPRREVKSDYFLFLGGWSIVVAYGIWVKTHYEIMCREMVHMVLDLHHLGLTVELFYGLYLASCMSL